MEIECAIIADGVQLPPTPTKNTNASGESEKTPPRPMALKDVNTPRRSTRKSTKPIQEYSEIVSAKRITRSRVQEQNEDPSEKNTQDTTASEGVQPEQPRWTPAKVGRVSHKRSKRGRKPKGKLLELKEQPETLKSRDESEKEEILTTTTEGKESVEEMIKPLSGDDRKNIAEEETSDEGLSPIEMEFGADDSAMVDKHAKKEIEISSSFEDRTANRTYSLDNSPDRIASNAVDNETAFDTSDCIIVSPADKSSTPPQGTVAVEPIKDKKTYVMASFVLSDDESGSETNMSSPLTTTNIAAEHTPISFTTPLVTRKRSSSFRVPTPYKQLKADVEEQTSEEPKIDTMDTLASNVYNKIDTHDDDDNVSAIVQMQPGWTTLSPKAIVLRSIRKRSISLTIDGSDGEHQQRRWRANNRVTFFSPANQTVDIDEVDVLIAQNLKRTNDYVGTNKEENHENRGMMGSRKRSISLDDRFRRTEKSPKAVPAPPKLTPKKPAGTPAKAQSNGGDIRGRTKLPNFAAIHQRNFNRMENLVEHVARKAERAKVLSASATKCPTSATKSRTPAMKDSSAVKTSTPQAVGSRRIMASGGPLNRPNRPKAMKKIEMPANDTIGATAPTPVTPNITNTIKILNLPMITIDSLLITKPPNRNGAASKMAVVKPMIAKTSANTLAGATQNASVRNKLNNPIKSNAIPSVPTQKKGLPASSRSFQFTALSASKSAPMTKTPTKLVNKSGIQQNKIIAFSAADNTITTTSTTGTKINASLRGDIVGTRRQKHMEMFKGRDGARTAEKRRNVDQIQGVRSNRRFELQMQHRRNLESGQQ